MAAEAEGRLYLAWDDTLLILICSSSFIHTWHIHYRIHTKCDSSISFEPIHPNRMYGNAVPRLASPRTCIIAHHAAGMEKTHIRRKWLRCKFIFGGLFFFFFFFFFLVDCEAVQTVMVEFYVNYIASIDGPRVLMMVLSTHSSEIDYRIRDMHHFSMSVMFGKGPLCQSGHY